MPRGRPRKTPQDVLIRSAEFIGWALGGLEREILQTRQRLGALTTEAARLRARRPPEDAHVVAMAMTAVAAQPMTVIPGPSLSRPIALGFRTISIIRAISGTARTPFTTALQ